MVPWWGVIVACFLFGLWSILCFMVGAALKDTAIKSGNKGIVERNMGNNKGYKSPGDL